MAPRKRRPVTRDQLSQAKKAVAEPARVLTIISKKATGTVARDEYLVRGQTFSVPADMTQDEADTLVSKNIAEWTDGN